MTSYPWLRDYEGICKPPPSPEKSLVKLEADDYLNAALFFELDHKFDICSEKEDDDCVVEIPQVTVLQEHSYSKLRFCSSVVIDEEVGDGRSNSSEVFREEVSVCDQWFYEIEGKGESESRPRLRFRLSLNPVDPDARSGDRFTDGAGVLSLVRATEGDESEAVEKCDVPTVGPNVTPAGHESVDGLTTTDFQSIPSSSSSSFSSSSSSFSRDDADDDDDDEDYLAADSATRHMCRICRSIFPTRSQLTKHYNDHIHDRKSLSCPECDLKFKALVKFLIHLKQHENESARPVKRRRSSSSFSLSEDLPAGFQRRPKIKPLSCLFCLKPFFKFSHLIAHQEVHKAEGYKCPFCFSQFSSMKDLVFHAQDHKNDLNIPHVPTPPAASKPPPLLAPPNLVPRKRYSCSYCEESFADTKLLSSHHLTHVKSRRNFVCNFCLETFQDQESFSRHRLWHIKDKKGFFHKSSRAFPSREMIEETKKSSRATVETETATAEEESVSDPRAEPTLPEKEKCVSLDPSVEEIQVKIEPKYEVFPEEPVLERVDNVPAAPPLPPASPPPPPPPQPFSCPDCDAKFSNPKRLISHSRRFHPFACPDCHKAFTWLADLKLHREVYRTKPLRVSRCPKLALVPRDDERD